MVVFLIHGVYITAKAEERLRHGGRKPTETKGLPQVLDPRQSL
jgi:hypothetical protein